jgi:glycosyltransferase involved in cell wall biosynthesis
VPTTSVLLPARDAEATLAEALASVLAQTDRDLEILLVDDASRDRTREVAALFSGDSRLRLLEGKGEGLVAALELARREARGRYLLRMDADDIAHPERLALQRAFLESDPRIACVSSLVASFPAPALGRRLYDAWLNAHLAHEAMARVRFVESPVAHPSVLLRADAVAAVGGYRDEPWPEDWDLWLRLFEKGHRFAKVPRVLLRWRERADRLSRTDLRYEKEALFPLRARYLRAPLAGRATILCGAGKGGAALARALAREGVAVRAFVDVAARRIGREKAGVPVHGLDEIASLRQDALVIGVAGGRGARAKLRSALRAQGLTEGVDFLLAQ